MNSTGKNISNHYIFKKKRPREEFISLCEDRACMGMHKNGYMDVQNISNWITLFLNYHKRKENLSHIKKILLILDGHKSHVFLQVLLKTMNHGLDMINLPSHSSHKLQLLDILYVKPFKYAFRTYKDVCYIHPIRPNHT